MFKKNIAVGIEIDMYKKMFNEFYKKITPISNKIISYYTDPLEHPHYLSYELLQEMELLHKKLSTDLYRLRFGELEEKLKIKEINLVDFNRLTKELDDINKLYKHI